VFLYKNHIEPRFSGLFFCAHFLLPNREYELGVSVLSVKDIQIIDGEPVLPTMTLDDDTFAYGLLIDYENEITFTTIPEPATICLLTFGGFVLLMRKSA
jgi:hypothetical protein